MFLLQMAIQVIPSSVQQSAFATWKEAVVVHTITKEKGKKMPRFNTESNEYRVTFNELNVHSVPDILKTLQNLFDSVLTDVTKGMQEEDFRKADMCYIQLYTMVQDELFVGV
jgi:predicted phage-related endonuclease